MMGIGKDAKQTSVKMLNAEIELAFQAIGKGKYLDSPVLTSAKLTNNLML